MSQFFPRSLPVKWIMLAVLVCDLALIGLHLLKVEGFDLDGEGNLPTLYQSTKLFIVGMLCFRSAFLNSTLRLWLSLLGIMFTYLAIDEWFQLHEKVSDLFHRYLLSINTYVNFSAWIIAYIPLMLLALFIFYYSYKTAFLSTINSYVDARRWFLLGVLCFCLVIVFEVIGTWGWNLAGDMYHLTAGLEEGLELFGVSCFGASILLLRGQGQNIVTTSNSV